MDPVTAALVLANTILQLAMKVYDDTAPEVRRQNAQIWANLVAAGEKFLTTGKLPT